MRTLEDRLLDIESRLGAIERSIAARPSEPDRSAGVQAEHGKAGAQPAIARVEAPAPALALLTPPVLPRAASGDTTEGKGSGTLESSIEPESSGAPNAHAINDGESLRTFERLVGGRWYVVAGSVVVTIGVALFVQLAVQQGWLQAVPPSIKCSSAGVFGLVLLALGEWLRRRVNAWAAFGLNAAGLGSIYVASAAAHMRYDLLDSGVAFVLLGACAALGVVIGARARLAGVTVVALVMGYVAPFLVATENPDPRVLPALWLMLQGVGLTLAGSLAGAFRVARWLTFAMTIFLGGVWVLAEGDTYPVLAGVFLIGTWSMIHAELVWSARREALARASRFWPALVGSYLTSGWASALGVFVTHQVSGVGHWVPPAAGAVASGIASLILAGHLRFLRDRPNSAGERLGAMLMTQAAALAMIGLSIGLEGPAEVVAWIAIGAAGLAAGRWIGAPGVMVFGVVSLGVATLRLCAFDAWTSMHAGGAAGVGLVFTVWTLMMVLNAGGWMLASSLILWPAPERAGAASCAPGRVARTAAVALAGLGWLTLLLACVSARAEPAALVLAWLSLAIAASAAARFSGRTHASWMWLLAFLLWCGTYLRPNAWAGEAWPPLLHRGVWLSILAGAGGVVIVRRASRSIPETDARGAIRIVAWILALACVFASTSLEAMRVAGTLLADQTARAAALSIWWGVYAGGLLIAGFVVRSVPVRLAGLGLLALAAIKAVVLDLAGVSLGARTLSVFGLGMLMMVVGVAYAWGSRAARARE